jgi:flagellar hook-associated protein 2
VICPDTGQITQAVNDFVSAYNTVINDLNTQYQVNPVTNREGPLGGDPSLRSLQSSLLSDAAFALPLTTTGGAVNNGGYVNLASLGIITNNDGTLTVVTTPSATQPSFAQALAANPLAVQSFFQNSLQTGFATNFSKDLTNLTDPTQGALNVALAQNQTTIQNLTTNITNFQSQLTAQQQQLTAQYEQVNASLQAYPLLLQQMTEILGTLGSGSASTTANPTPTLTGGL